MKYKIFSYCPHAICGLQELTPIQDKQNRILSFFCPRCGTIFAKEELILEETLINWG